MSRVGDSEASSTSSLNVEFEIANPISAKGNCLSEQSSCLYIGSRSSRGIEHFPHYVDPKMNNFEAQNILYSSSCCRSISWWNSA